jgi:hypothetical protein
MTETSDLCPPPPPKLSSISSVSQMALRGRVQLDEVTSNLGGGLVEAPGSSLHMDFRCSPWKLNPRGAGVWLSGKVLAQHE